MKILIVTNFSLTPMQVRVGRSLTDLAEIYYLCVSQHTKNICVDSGVSESNIIQISLKELQLPKVFRDFYSLNELKPSVLFNDLVSIDRYLSRRSASEIVVYKKLINDLASVCVGSGFFDVIFGESTWTHELALSRACQQFGGCRYFSPHTVRYPSGRWAFFEGESQENLVSIDKEKVASSDIPPVEDILLKKPYYLKLNDEKLKKASSIRGWVSSFLRFILNSNMEFENPCLLDSRLKRLRIHWFFFINRIWYRLALKKLTPKDLKKKKYVLMTLHKQPESSIDVQSKNFDDQAQLAKFIWRKLPDDWILVIKEHSNAVGDRGRKFFKKLACENDIVFLDEKANTLSVIRNSQLVFSASGTPCLEASLLGIPAFTVAPVFFNKLKGCDQLTSNDLLKSKDISVLIAEKRNNNFNELSPSDYVEWIINNSFEGTWTDAETMPDSLDIKNVNKIINGHRSLLRSISNQW